MLAMRSRLFLCCSIIVASAADGDGSGSLRGSASTSIAPTGAMEEGLHHLHCSCRESATCDCRTTSSGASMPVEDEVELRQAILNDTQQLQALWKTHGSHDAQVSCSCAMESDDCQCEYNATSLNETAVASINETAKLLSSWWAGEGGHVDAYGRGLGCYKPISHH